MSEELPGLKFLSAKGLGNEKIDLYSRNNDPERVTNRLVKSNRVTKFPYISLSDLSPQGIDNTLNNFCKLIDLHRLSISRQLVEAKFAKKFSFDSIKNDIDYLFNSGFAFREPIDSRTKAEIRMKNSLEIYPFHNFKVGESKTNDCIGFLNTKGKLWDGYINFYSEDIGLELTEEIKKEIKIYPEWVRSIPTANRLFLMEPQEEQEREEKRVNNFFSLLKGVSKKHEKGSKSIWPRFMGEKMLSEYITFFQDFELLEFLIKGDLSIKETLENYESKGNILVLKKMLRFNEDCFNKHKYIMPVIVNSENRTLALTEEYRDWVKGLTEKTGGLASLMGINPLLEYLQPLASTCLFLKNKIADTYSDSLWGYFFLDQDKTTEIFIQIKLFGDKLDIRVGVAIEIDKNKQLISNIDELLKDKFGSYFFFEPVKERILHKQPAVQFAFIKDHNNYEIMKNEETMKELYENINSFFVTIFEMLGNGLKK